MHEQFQEIKIMLKAIVENLEILNARVDRIERVMVTKDDLQAAKEELRAEFKADIKRLDDKFTKEIAGLRAEVKADIKQLDDKFTKEIAGLRAEVKADIKQLDDKFTKEIAGLRAEVKADIKQLDAKLSLETGKLTMDIQQLDHKVCNAIQINDYLIHRIGDQDHKIQDLQDNTFRVSEVLADE